MSRQQPLVGLSSIRTRLAVLVGASVLVAAVVGTVGTDAGVPLWLGLPATIGVALVVTRWLAAGITAPLVEMTAAAQRMARGDYSVRVTTSGTDEVGELARAFATMAEDLASADEHRRRLVATVAHELRTPLSAQQALLENLVDGIVTPDDAALRTALGQSERLGSLVADLLDLSRPDGRGTPLSPTRVVVRDLLGDAAGESTLQGRDVRVVVDVEPPDLTVTADPARLAQAGANLLDNAVRHSPPGGTVTLTARPEGDRWSLTVADEGPGLPAERAGRLRQRFGTGTDEGGGTGLGLAIAGWVASMHGGTLSALPEDGSGARLRLLLPVSPPQHASPSPDPLAPHTPTAREEIAVSTPPAPTTSAGEAAPPSSPRSWWPERTSTPQPRLLLAALGVGTAASILLPEDSIGLGMLVVLTLGGAAIWAASPRRSKPWSWVTAALALPLGLTTVLRGAEGFTFLAVTTAGVLAAAACTDARTVTGIAASVAAWPLSALRGLPLLDRTVRALARRGGLWSVLRTTAVSLVLLLVFGGLLASADAVLGSWTAHLVPEISDSLVFRLFTLVFFAGVTLAGLYLAINPPAVDGLRAGSLVRARIPALEWQIPLGLVIAVFALFIVAQGAALLGGHDYVLRTTGLTYAEYAREGFGQLTLATALVLLLVAGVRAWGGVRTAADRRVMQVLCALLTLLTLLVVASALRRMALYQDAFGYTIARVGADLIEVWFGLVLLAVLVSLFTSSRRWLGRTVLASGAALMILFTVGNTSAWVAERNIERWQQTGHLDEQYLSSLPDDAVPAIHESELPERTKACILHTGHAVEPADAGLSGWNLARGRAADIRSDYAPDGSCTLGTR